MSTVIDRVQKKFPKFTRNIQRASRAAQIFNAQTKSMRQNLQKLGSGMKRLGVAMTLGVTLPLTALAAQGVKSFGDFEQGLRGIEKTTGLSRVKVAELGVTFDQLSTKIPVTTAEMLELTKAGGQLGVKGAANLEKFTVVMAKLGRASDVAGEAGAKSIARILTVTGDGIGQIDRFSSALVDLGNNAAASESEILEIANRVAGQVGRFDVGSAAVLGMSTALKALGKRAESAGSVVGRSFDAINQAIKGGGEQAKLLSKLTGISGADLEKTFKKDATLVFQKFVEGLAKVEKGGGNMIKVLKQFRLEGVRINDVLGTLVKRPEVLAENLERSAKAFKKNTALQKEFEIQTDSFNSEMLILTNTFTSLLRLIGKELAPAVSFFGKIFKAIFDFLRNNPTIRTLVIVLGAVAAALGPILFLAGAFLIVLPSLAAGFVAIGVTSFAAVLPILLIGAGIATLIAVVVALTTNWDSLIESLAGSDNVFASLLGFILSVVDALGKLIGFLVFVIANLNSLKALGAGFSGLKNVLGFGDDTKKTPGLGANVGARNKSSGLGQGALTSEPVNGQIGITFANAPAGIKVRSEATGPLDFNLGFVGGLQ